jgi:nitrilase
MKVKVGLIQDSPVFFNLEETVRKVERLTGKYAAEGCELIVFPKSFIPGYPRGFDFGAVIGSRTREGRELYATYHENSLDLKGKHLKRLEKLSKELGIYLVMGATEKEQVNSSLFCSMLYISPEEGLLGVHRKIKPTGTERLVWAEADGSSLVTFDTSIGRLGGLICWENYMPLARMSMYQKGLDIYIAPTADAREQWVATMRHVALEGRCFVLGCNQYFTRSMYPAAFKELVDPSKEEICPGGSLIVSPLGEIIEGPLFGSEGALIAELDLREVPASRLDFDVNGHYNRKDIFTFEAKGQPETKTEKSKI